VVALSTTAWWILGYAVGGAIVAVAAVLLVLIILLARRIAHQAGEITLALDGAMRNTNALFELANMNHAIESITRGLNEARGESGIQDERSRLQRFVSRVRPGTEA
jgi:hypothetical protein